MLEPIYLPENVEITEDGPNTTTFSIHPYHPGYGPTVGNALRRVLLSSLPGAAITFLKVEGVDHEFSAIDGVKEDAISIILNLKKVRIDSSSDEPVEIRLKAEGEKVITAGDFDTPPEVNIANPDQVIATLTDKEAKVDLICTVERGRGYVTSESLNTKEKDIGTIALDATFTPVQRVSFNIANVRVGQATDYHKLTLTVQTDGTMTPREALSHAASIMADHFSELTGDFEARLTDHRPEEIEMSSADEEPEIPENNLNLLRLPSRVHNALERIGITTVEQVMQLTNEQIQDIPGLGAKAISDIKESRDTYKERMEEEKK